MHPGRFARAATFWKMATSAARNDHPARCRPHGLRGSRNDLSKWRSGSGFPPLPSRPTRARGLKLVERHVELGELSTPAHELVRAKAATVRREMRKYLEAEGLSIAEEDRPHPSATAITWKGMSRQPQFARQTTRTILEST